MPSFTPQDVAARLGRPVSTIQLWCRQGRFPNAKLERTPRGTVWLVPERDLKTFRLPARGRNAKAQRLNKAVQPPNKGAKQ